MKQRPIRNLIRLNYAPSERTKSVVSSRSRKSKFKLPKKLRKKLSRLPLNNVKLITNKP